MKNADSVKERLRNYAKKNNRIVQEVFTAYILEHVLYRLSISEYKNNFILKGGILLYGMFVEEFSRATTDIDLLGKNISNDPSNLEQVFREILSIPYDDPIRFDLDSIHVKNITEFKEYHGINISLNAYLDRTRIPVNIDIGFGDVIFPDRLMMDYPTLLGDASPKLYAYSLESIIAEKFEAIVSLGLLNSRYKDFFDICLLADRFDFEGRKLQEAVMETFSHRNTSFEIISAFEEGFCDDPYRKGRWNGFQKSKNVSDLRSLEDTVAELKIFLLPVVECLRQNQPFALNWDHQHHSWV